MTAPQELNPIQLDAAMKEMFASGYSIFGPLTGLDEPAVRAVLESFGVEGCPEAYLSRMARKCRDREVAFRAQYFQGELLLVKDQRTLSFPVYCDVPGRGRCSLLEYVLQDGVWMLRNHPDGSETYAQNEKDIRHVLFRAICEEFGIPLRWEHVADEYLIPFEGKLQLVLDQLESKEYLHDVDWSPKFKVRNRVHRCGWNMPYIPEYFREDGYIDTGTTHWFRWHGSDGKLITF